VLRIAYSKSGNQIYLPTRWKVKREHSSTNYQQKYSEYAKFTENTLDELIKFSEKENENRSKP